MEKAVTYSDLIYDNKAWPEIKKQFPAATATDASDFVHEHRIEVEVDTDESSWFKFLIREGMFEISLKAQLTLHMYPEKIRALLDELKAGDRKEQQA